MVSAEQCDGIITLSNGLRGLPGPLLFKLCFTRAWRLPMVGGPGLQARSSGAQKRYGGSKCRASSSCRLQLSPEPVWPGLLPTASAAAAARAPWTALPAPAQQGQPLAIRELGKSHASSLQLCCDPIACTEANDASMLIFTPVQVTVIGVAHRKQCHCTDEHARTASAP